MYTDFYGLSFNPFDKQMVKEKDAFESEDFREMTAVRVLERNPGNWSFYS